MRILSSGPPSQRSAPTAEISAHPSKHDRSLLGYPVRSNRVVKIEPQVRDLITRASVDHPIVNGSKLKVSDYCANVARFTLKSLLLVNVFQESCSIIGRKVPIHTEEIELLCNSIIGNPHSSDELSPR